MGGGMGLGVGVGLGPMIGGLVADAFGYDAAFFITATLLAVSGFIVLFGVDEGFKRTRLKNKQVHSLYTHNISR